MKRPARPRTITEAVEYAACCIDDINARVLRELETAGAEEEVLGPARARLAARRQEILAKLWLRLEG